MSISASSRHIYLGKNKLKTKDFINIVSNNYKVRLDKVKIKNDSIQNSNSNIKNNILIKNNKSLNSLSNLYIRSILLSILISISNKSFKEKYTIMNQIVILLNQNINVYIKNNSTLNEITKHIINTLIGDGEFLSSIYRKTDKDKQAIIYSKHIKEINVSLGILIYELELISDLLKQADIVAALTCECFHQDFSCFDPVKMEAKINNKNINKICLNLKILLEESRLCTLKSNKNFLVLREIPMYHGSVNNYLKECVDNINAFVNCQLDYISDYPISISLLSLTNSLKSLLFASINRIKLLHSKLDLSYLIPEFDLLLNKTPKTTFDQTKLLKKISNTIKNTLFYELIHSINSLYSQQESKIALVKQKQEEKTKINLNKKENFLTSEKRKAIFLKKSKLGLGKRTLLYYNAVKDIKIQKINLHSLKLSFTEDELWELSKEHSGRIINVESKNYSEFINKLFIPEKSFKNVKIPKGTRDITPEMMIVREKAIGKIVSVFHRVGAVGIDTPIFELKETLHGKYGEESKLIYDLEDQGGELLSLRYDLTVPFARYVAMNGVGCMKRYHIGKVYRRDQPIVTKGKFREFYQCDFDICGRYDLMIPDSEVITVICLILKELEIGSFTVRINHRKLLDAILRICGVPTPKFKEICSAIDKLDKVSWEEIEIEMIEEKGLNKNITSQLKFYVDLIDEPFKLITKLSDEKFVDLLSDKDGKIGISELKILFNYLQSSDVYKYLKFDLSLARGLDYYTGVIFEAYLNESNKSSIAGGGRYDGLIGMFSNKDIPAVGASIGIERLLAIFRNKNKSENCSKKINHTSVIIASNKNCKVEDRIKLVNKIRKDGINADFIYMKTPKAQSQINYALDMKCPFMVFLFSDSFSDKGVVELKDLNSKKKEKVRTVDIIDVLRERIK